MSYLDMFSRRTQNAGHCGLCNTDFQVDEEVFTHANPPGVERHQFHSDCIIRKLGMLDLVNPTLTCSDCQLNITHVNGKTVNEHRELLDKEGADLLRISSRGELAKLDAFEKKNPNWDKIHPQWFENAVSYTSSYGHVDFFRKLNASPNMTDELRGIAFWRTATKGKASNDDYMYAELCPAATNHHIEILKLLKDAQIPDNYYNVAVVQAAKYGYTDSLKQLLLKPISDDVYSKAVAAAWDNGHIESIAYLLSEEVYPANTKKKGLVPKDQLVANFETFTFYKNQFLEASLRGDVEEVERLLENQNIKRKTEWYGEAICAIANLPTPTQKHIEIVTKLLNPGTVLNENNESVPLKISKLHLGVAVVSAATNAPPFERVDESSPLLALLLGSGEISQKHRSAAVVAVASSPVAGKEELLLKLLQESILCKDASAAFLKVAQEHTKPDWKKREYLYILATNPGWFTKESEDQAEALCTFFDFGFAGNSYKKALVEIKERQEAAAWKPHFYVPSSARQTELAEQANQRLRQTQSSLDHPAGGNPPSSNGTISSSSESRRETTTSETTGTLEREPNSTSQNTENNTSTSNVGSRSRTRNRAPEQTSGLTGNQASVLDASTGKTSTASKSFFNSFFSKETAIKVAKVVLPILAVIGLVLAIYVSITLGLVHPLTIGVAVGVLVMTIASIALYILTRKSIVKDPVAL